MKRIETSKKILLFTDILAVVITIISVIAVFVLHDASPLSYLIPGIFGLTATSHGFYFWKAKAENIAKYAKKGIDTTGIREE